MQLYRELVEFLCVRMKIQSGYIVLCKTFARLNKNLRLLLLGQVLEHLLLVEFVGLKVELYI